MNLQEPISSIGETARMLEEFDWSKTSLGPRSSWSEGLTMATKLCLSHKQPALVAWGEDLIQIYNDSYAELIATKHPSSFGVKGRQSWISQWAEVAPMLQSVLNDGKSFHMTNRPFNVTRRGYPERNYFTFSFEPLHTTKGVEGIFVTVAETTNEVLTRKRNEENEIRARLGIEASGLGTFESDPALGYFKFSERLAAIFGYSDIEDLTPESFKDRIHPEDEPIRLGALETLAKTGVLFYEARLIWPDGSIHWVRLNGVMLDDATGKANTLYGTALDITESKVQNEVLGEELRRSHERYHRMIDEVQDYAIILLNTDGIIQNWNTGAEKIKQYTEEEAVGRHFSIFYLPDDQKTNLPNRLIAEALHFGKATHEGWRVRKDGSRFWGSILITALHDNQGDVIGFSKVTRDLTERKIAEDKMIQYTIELEARNKELEQFAFVASHDLQEPLRKIQTFSELIQSNLHEEETVKLYFDKINVSAQRMRDLIRATLNYSALTREDLETRSVDLNKSLAEVKTDMELLIQVKKVIIRSKELPNVHGNAIQIGQVFSNLIGNAIKFSVKPPIIEISSKVISRADIPECPQHLAEPNYFEITFRDYGIGFEPEYEKRIFSIFQRLHGKSEFEGTGIGLALCKKIMENHHGYIRAVGDPGAGASFFLYFPYITIS